MTKNEENLFLYARLDVSNKGLTNLFADIKIIQDKLTKKGSSLKLKVGLETSIKEINTAISAIQTNFNTAKKTKQFVIPIDIDVKGTAEKIKVQLKEVMAVVKKITEENQKLENAKKAIKSDPMRMGKGSPIDEDNIDIIKSKMQEMKRSFGDIGLASHQAMYGAKDELKGFITTLDKGNGEIEKWVWKWKSAIKIVRDADGNPLRDKNNKVVKKDDGKWIVDSKQFSDQTEKVAEQQRKQQEKILENAKKTETAIINSYSRLYKITNERRRQMGKNALSYDEFKIGIDKVTDGDKGKIDRKIAQGNRELAIQKEQTQEMLRQQSIIKNADYNKLNTLIKTNDIESLKQYTRQLGILDKEIGEISVKTNNERNFSLITATEKGVGDAVQQVTYKINHQEKSVTKMSDSMVHNMNRNLGVWEQFKIAMERFPVWMLATTAYYGTARAIRAMATEIFELDKSLTELKRVADSSLNIESLFKNTLQLSQDLGNSVNSVMDTVNEFARTFGEFNEQQLLAVTRTATIASNVSELTTEEAGKNLVGVMTAFNIEAEKSIGIVDKMNEVDNNYAVSTAQLSDALSKSASVSKTYGVTLEENLGHVTAIASTTMESGAVIGNALKSIYTRISQLDESKKVFENLGISMKNSDGTIKSSSKLIEDLAGKWQDLSDEEKRNIAFKVAGLHQISRFTALLNNFQMSVKATNTALNSQGSATRENEKYLQSFEAKINKLKNKFTELSSAVGESFLSDAMMGLFGVLGKLAEVSIMFADKFGVLPSLFLALSPIIAGFGGFDKLGKTINATTQSIINFRNNYDKLKLQGNNRLDSFGQSLGFTPSVSSVVGTGEKVINKNLTSELTLLAKTATPAQRAVKGLADGQIFLNSSTKGAYIATEVLNKKTGLMEYSFQVATTTTKTFATALKSIGTSMLWTGLFVVVGIAIEKLIGAYSRYSERVTKIREDNKKSLESYKANGVEIDSLVDKYKKLKDAMDSGIELSADKQKEFLEVSNKIAELMPNMVAKEDEKGNKILHNTKLLEKQTEQMKEQLNIQQIMARKAYNDKTNDSTDEIEQAKQKLEVLKSMAGDFGAIRSKIAENAWTPVGNDKVFDDIDSAMWKVTHPFDGNDADVQEFWQQRYDQLQAIVEKGENSISQAKLDLMQTAINLSDVEKNNIFNAFDKDGNGKLKESLSKQVGDVAYAMSEIKGIVGKGLDFSGFTDIKDIDKLKNLKDSIKSSKEEIEKLAKSGSSVATANEKFSELETILTKVTGNSSFANSIMKNLIKTVDDSSNTVAWNTELTIANGSAKDKTLATKWQLTQADVKHTLAIDDETDALDENTKSTFENINATALMLGKTEEDIGKINSAIAVIRAFGNQQNLTSEQSNALAESILFLNDQFPAFSGSIIENIDSLASYAGIMNEITDVTSDINNVLATSQDAQVIATALALKEKITLWNQEISALDKLQDAYNNLANQVIKNDYVLTGHKANVLNDLQQKINSKKINIDVSVKGISQGIADFNKIKPSSSSGSGSSSSSPLADLFKIDTLERQHKAYEDIINSLSSKLQSLNKNSVAYRNTLKSIIDYELKNMALEKQQIAQKEARNIAIQRRLSVLGNTSRHTKAQRDEYNDLQKEYEDNLSNISSLSKSIQDTLNEIKDKSLEIFTDFIDEIVTNYETAVKKIQDSIDNTEFKIDVHGYINPDNIKELMNLYVQKAMDAQKVQKGKQDEVNSLNTAYNNAVAQYGSSSDQAKKALEELNKAKEELEDAMIGVLQAEKEIQDTRSKVADEAIDALKDYYKNMESMATDAIDKEKEQFQKLHDDKIKAYDDEVEAINKVYDAKFKQMDKEKSEDEYQAELNEKNNKKAELMNKITLLSKDDSRSGKKSLSEAKAELDELNKEITKFQNDRQLELTKQALEDQKQVQLDGIEAKKKAEDDALEGNLENLDKQKEAISKHYEDLINNDAYWAKLRNDAIKGSFTTLNAELSKMKINLDNMNLGIFNGLTDGIKGVSLKFVEMSDAVKKEINKVNSLLVDNMIFNLKTPLADILGMINSVGYAMTNAGVGNASNASAKPTTNTTTYVPPKPVVTQTPVQQSKPVSQPTVVYYPAPSYGGSSIVDALKSIGVPSDMATRTKIASKNGISGYSGTASQNLQLLSLLKRGRLARFKQGGFVGNWTGDFGKLAMVDSGEIILKEKDTSNLFDILDLMNKSILPVIKHMNLASDFVNSGKANAITNNTTLNINIEKITGDKDGGNTVLSTIIKGMKKLGK